MIVVKVEMWPQGDESRKYPLGRTYIYNAGGTAKRADYEVRVCRKGSYDVRPRDLVEGNGFTRVGNVKDWPRKSYNIWRLILRALRSAFPEEQ